MVSTLAIAQKQSPGHRLGEMEVIIAVRQTFVYHHTDGLKAPLCEKKWKKSLTVNKLERCILISPDSNKKNKKVRLKK